MALARTPYGFMMFAAAVAGLYAAVTWVLRRIEKVEIVPVEAQVEFLPMRSTSRIALQLDPRAELEAEES